MQKHVFEIEKLRKVTLYAVLLLLVLILAFILLLQTSYIQTQITNFVTKELSEKLNSKITISNVKISLFRGFVFKKIYIEDQQKDTLLYVEDLSIIPSGLQLDINDLSLKEIKINKIYLNLYKVNEDTLNIQYLLDAIKNDDNKNQNNFKIKSQKFSLINSRFSFNISDTIIENKLDFKNIKLDSIFLKLKYLKIDNDDIISEIENFSFKENQGFAIKKLSSKKVHISPKQVHLKDFEIKTPTSNLMFDSLNFDYPANYDFSRYRTTLKNNIYIKKESYFSYRDIKFFIPDTSRYDAIIEVSGDISGEYDNFLATNLTIQQKDIFFLKLSSKVKGLSDLKDPSFFIKMNKLEINFLKLKEAHLPYEDLMLKNIPNWLKDFKTVTYSGITKGRFSNFTTEGKLFGDFGNISLNAHALKDTANRYKINGEISAKELQISKVVKNKNVGLLTFSQSFDFILSKKKYKIKTSGRINEFFYKKQLYKDIDLYSEISNNKIDSINILIDQPLLSARILGRLDLSKSIPEVELFANVANADVSSLKLVNLKNKFNNVNFIAEAKFEGLNFNDFLGSIKLNKPLTYKKDSLKYKIDNFILTSKITNSYENKKEIVLKSAIADFKLITYKKSSSTINLLEKLKNKILQTSVETKNIKKDTSIIDNPISFEANIKKADIFMSFFNSEYHISDNTKVYGFYNPQKNNINLSLNSKFFKYKNITVEDFYFMIYTKNNKTYGGIGGSSIKPSKNFFAENVSLEGDYSKDSINFNLSWDNFKDSANYSANISGKVNIKTKNNQKKYYDCSLRNSRMTINDILWKFNDANFIIDSSKISIFDLTLTNNKQKIYLDGNISEYPGDILFAEYENFKISNIQPLIKKDIKLEGELSGNTTFARIYDKPLIFTKDSIINLNINKIDFGNFYFKTNWDNQENKIHINAYNLKGKYRKFMNDTIYGDYWPNTGNVNFVADIRSMLVETFKEYYSDYVSFSPTTYIKGKMFLYGHYKNLKVKGNIKLKQASLLIKYLNTYYSVDNMDIYFDDKNIQLSKTKLMSENDDGVAFISGNISHKLFSNFDIDIDVDANNFQIMKKRRTQISYFYGTAYGTGNLNFSGPLNNVFLDANLKTEKGTYIFIPMSASEALKEEQSFIRFVTDTTILKQTIKKDLEYSADLNGFTMNLLIDVTPDATIEIIPDENGDIITNGTGSLILKIDSEGNFNMFGPYIISKGNYKINLGSIKKTFTIKNDSKIKWDGDPKNAIIDITATYKLNNVKLNNLLPPDETETEKSEVDCFVNLKGTIFDPILKLDIVLPDNVSQKYKSKIASFEEKDINEQFLSLLIMKRFFYDLGAEFADSKPLTGDLLTSSFNNLLKKVSKDFDMTLIYQPGQETVTDEYGFVLSGSAFDDRLIYKGGVGIGGNEIENKEEAIVGEAEVELKLDKKGNFKAKFYNKANDQLENDGTYTQGVGLIWRQKFDNIFWWKNKEKNDTITQKQKNEK